VTLLVELDKAAASTPQHNEPILTKSIFGVNVTIVEIQPREEFSTSFVLSNIAAETHRQTQTDERQIDRILVKEEIQTDPIMPRDYCG